jgi:hypothetical protein
MTFTGLPQLEFFQPQIALALNAIDEAGLQAPSSSALIQIVTMAHVATLALQSCALIQPAESECRELFEDFVVR